MAARDAIVVGSGPNGLAAAITLARAGVAVQVLEAEATIGGAVRSLELTLPGFVHDFGSAIHPLAFDSPFFRTLPLGDHGLQWVHSPAVLAHPLDGGDSVTLEIALGDTAAQLGADEQRYRKIFSAAAAAWAEFLKSPTVGSVMRHAGTAAHLGLASAGSATGFVSRNFHEPRTRALISGMAAHSTLPLTRSTTAGIAIALATAGHVGGWPFPRGGAQKLTDALASYLRSLGGAITTGMRVRNLRELSSAGAVLLDITPRQF